MPEDYATKVGRTGWPFLVTALALTMPVLAAGCGDDEPEGAGSDRVERLACQADADCEGGTCTVYGCLQTVTETIGADGGTVSTAGGEVILEVPAGALDADTPITIRPLLTALWNPGDRFQGDHAVGTAFEIAYGTSFAELVTVTMSYAGLDLRGHDEDSLCVIGSGLWSGDEIAGEDCRVNLSDRTVRGGFEDGDKFIIAAFDPDWDTRTRPTAEGTPSTDEAPPSYSPAMLPLPVEDDFDGAAIDTKLWTVYLQESSTLELSDGVVRATAAVDGDTRARSGLFADYAITEAAQALQSRIRVTGSSGDASANRVRAVEGYAYKTRYGTEDEGQTGEMYARITINLDGTVGPLVFLCGDPACSAGDVIYSDSFATTAALNEWHTYSLGFDAVTATFYFQMDDGPIVSYEADTEAYPMLFDTWYFMAARAEARTNPGSTISIEIDRLRVGSLSDIFGTLP